MGDNKKDERDLLDLIVDTIILGGKALKVPTYKVLNIKERYNLEDFFKNAGLVNKSGEFPIQKKIVTEGDIDTYYMSIPDGLSSKNFFDYKQPLEEKYNRNIEIKYDDGLVLIEVSKKVVNEENKGEVEYE